MLCPNKNKEKQKEWKAFFKVQEKVKLIRHKNVPDVDLVY